MKVALTIAVASLSLYLAVPNAHAEAEGNGEPFAWRVPARAVTGGPLALDTGAEVYPQFTGRAAGPAPQTAMAAYVGSEPCVQSSNSLPQSWEEGTLAYAQARPRQQRARPSLEFAQGSNGLR